MAIEKPLWEQLSDSDSDERTPEQIAKEEADKALKLEEEKAKKEEEEKKKEDETKRGRGRPPKEKTETKTEEKSEEEKKVEQEKEEKKIEEEIDEATQFYTEVFSLTGDTADDIDFGNTDPLSPEGVVKFVEYKQNQRQLEIDKELSERAPIEYQALLMRLAGKDPSSLYDKTGFIDYSKLEVAEDNIDLQKEIIRKDMEAHGIPKERQEKLITLIANEGELFEEAIKSQKTLSENQKKELELETQKAKEEKEAYAKSVDNFLGLVNSTVGKGEVGNFQVIEKDKQAFFDFVKSNVRYVDGQFVNVVPISNENFNKVMQTMYFDFKGGNLKSLVEKQAKTDRVIRLRTVAENSRIPNSNSEQLETPKKAKSWKDEIE